MINREYKVSNKTLGPSSQHSRVANQSDVFDVFARYLHAVFNSRSAMSAVIADYRLTRRFSLPRN